MDKNIKNTLILVFVIIWVIAIIIAFQKGKKKAIENYADQQVEDILQEEKLFSKTGDDKLLDPKPVLFQAETEEYHPKMYVLKQLGLKDDLRIINTRGDELSLKQSEKMNFNYFAFNILDSDIKTSEQLKKEIKFEVEEQKPEEYYKGIQDTDLKVPRVKEEKSPVKKGETLIYTNQ